MWSNEGLDGFSTTRACYAISYGFQGLLCTNSSPDLDASSSASNFQSLYFGCSRRMSTVHHSWHIPLVVQDSNPPTTIVAAVRNTKSKRNRPLYSHCGIQGHTIDKRYKLHDYPPGYKFKPKAGTSNPQINQTMPTESTTSIESP